MRNYLAQIEALKKPNTHRKYEAVLDRFVEFFRNKESIDQIDADDLTRYIIALKRAGWKCSASTGTFCGGAIFKVFW